MTSSIETDAFQFRITLKDRPLTHRGVLATVSSIYDPLGFPNRKYQYVTVEEMELGEQHIVKLVQKQTFSKELNSLKQNNNVQDRTTTERKKRMVSKTSTLLRL